MENNTSLSTSPILARVTIYIDGACKGNPGPGGWGAFLLSDGREKELYGGEAQTTNNRMELTAAIRALEALKRPCAVDIWTDSEYVRRGMTEWMAGWRRRGWHRVKNVDLWRRLDALASDFGHRINWHWVEGHAGHPGNERADNLANRGVP